MDKKTEVTKIKRHENNSDIYVYTLERRLWNIFKKTECVYIGNGTVWYNQKNLSRCDISKEMLLSQVYRMFKLGYYKEIEEKT